jgi:serine/threonine-protein kinase
MREAKTGGRLAHPHIVELYDVNEQDGGLFYIVTEHVDGDSLAGILRARHGQGLPAADVMRAVTQIADALAYAHEQRIVHRDVKPANILIRRADRLAKLQGFTLAKNLERAGFSVITADGESLGTPYYMPPEQVRSAKSVDERSDIYSWAATTYHCLSGRLPQEARSYGEFIDRVFNHDPTPIESHVPGLPPALVRLLGACLARDPAARPPNMGAVLQGLEPVLAQLG